MSVYKNLLVYITLALFLSACSILQPRKQTVYDISDKAEAVEVDTDDNGAIDVAYGGTNASNAPAALSSLGAGDITAVGSVSSGDVAAVDLHTDILAYWVANGLNLSSVTVTWPAGGWYFTDEDSAPSTVGQFKYDNTVTNLDDGALCWYDDDEIKYLIDTPTIPSLNGEVPVYNESSNKWEPKQRNAIVHNTKSGAYTVGTDSAEECYGGVIYVTSAATITACDNLDSNMSFTVVTVGAIAVSVDTQADDLMLLDAVALDDGDKATNTSTTGDTIHFSYYSAAGWYAWSGSPDGDHWTDGGP